SVNKKLTIRRFALSANHITDESSIKTKSTIQQMDLFIDYEQLKKEEEEKLEKDLEKEKRLQEATLKLKQKYGKNAVLKGMNLVEGATGKDRNNTIGGHKA
ncbi:hypothetical protein PH488_17930, partial [Erysipelatoclostridium ramosum]|nr:hypothetical protein [Thomasclavelia ramosa]